MISMSIGQLKRSAIRRSLQTCFFEGMLAVLENAPKRGKLTTRYAASWKWMLTLCSLRQQGMSDDVTPNSVRLTARELGIHPGQNITHTHQRLFTSPGIASMPDTALGAGLEKMSNQS